MTRPTFLRTRLSGMMFLFYFGLGAWAVTLSTYLMSSPLRGGLYFTTSQVGWIYSTFAIGGMIAPFIIGILADRLFAVERVLGWSSLAAAGFLALAAAWCDSLTPSINSTFYEIAALELVDGRPVLQCLNSPEEAKSAIVCDAIDRVKEHPAVRNQATAAFFPLFGLMLGYCFCLQIGLPLITVMVLRNLPDEIGRAHV